MKYKLTKNTKEVSGITLYQIQALKDFANVKKGDLGGWIEKVENLSQDGNAWVYGNAWVSGNALVSGDAEVSGDALVFGVDGSVKNPVNHITEDVFDKLDKLSTDIDEVVIKGVRYKKVTAWKKIP